MIHFALFASACRYTHQRRRARMTSQTAMARDTVASGMTRNGQMISAQPPFTDTNRQQLPLKQPSPASASQSPTQQQNSFAASDPQAQILEQPTYPLTNLRQPPEAPSSIRVPQPTSSWILHESNANNVVYHPTLRHDVENHQSRAGQQATVTDSPSPVSPIMPPQSPAI